MAGTTTVQTTYESTINDYINQKGITGVIINVNNKINGANLTEVERYLVSQKEIYARALYEALLVESVNHNDVDGIFQSVLRFINTKTLPDYYSNLLEEVLTFKNINITNLSIYKDAIVDEMIKVGIPLTQNKAVKAVMSIYENVIAEGPYKSAVEKYINRSNSEIGEPDASNPFILDAMVDYLQNMNITFFNGFDASSDQSYDEYFALAYHNAKIRESGGDDPIDAIRNKGNASSWDFTVNTFDDMEQQGIIKRNIKAMGALIYIQELGHSLDVFKLTKALILKWGNGQYHFSSDSELESLLFRYYMYLKDRSSDAEQKALIKRTLNIGDAELASGTVVNTEFNTLWSNLLNEIVKYIGKTEEASNQSFISRRPIFRRIQDLQFNASAHMTGMAHIQVSEMYTYLQDSFELLSHPSIVDRVATTGSKNMWGTIQALYQEVNGISPNISSYKTAAVEAYNMFKFIADFDASTVSDYQFQDFLHKAENYILASSNKGDIDNSSYDEDEDFGSEDFDDWDI